MSRVVGNYRRYMNRRRYAAGTIRGRVMVATRWLAHVEDWRRCDHHDVEDWIADLPLSAASQRNYVSMLKSFYRWAQREQLVQRDPTALVDPPRTPRYKPRPARDSDVAFVLADVDDQLAAMIGLMAGAGLRCCEVSRLRWDDIDLHIGTAHVTGKGTRDRVIALGPDVLVLLARLATTAGRVFRNRFGKAISAGVVSRTVNVAFRTRGYSTTAHQLRHRAATTALVLAAGDLLIVRDFLGHSSVATTQVYTAVMPHLVQTTTRAIRLPTVDGQGL